MNYKVEELGAIESRMNKQTLTTTATKKKLNKTWKNIQSAK